VGMVAAAWLLALGLLGGDAFAAQPRVGLGAADSFAVLAGQSVSNSGSSTVNGDLGVSPGTAVTGFPPGTLNGKLHSADAVAARAQSDLRTAYDDAAARTPAVSLSADLGGLTLTPGVYKSASSSFALTGGLTLNGQGDPHAVFIFQAASTLTTASASHVNLLNGAQSCNVFWQIGSSATLGTSSVFAGDILAFTSISISDGVAMNGRALARNGAVTLSNDTITAAHCATPAGRTPGAPPGAPHHPRHGTTGGRPGTTGGRHPSRGTPGRGTNKHRRAVGFCAPNQTPTRTRARRPRHARRATAARRSRPVTHAGTHRPARPQLLSPRRRARVRAGIVRFSWRPAVRAAGYTLMVDRHRLNTRCLTSATLRIRPGSHSWRVIARNRYGARSSRARAFAATTAPSVDQIRKGLGLDVLDKQVLEEATQITIRAAESAAFSLALRTFAKFASRASVLGLLVSLGLDNGDLSCDQSELYRRGKPVFARAADVLKRTARAKAGPQPAVVAELAQVQSGLRQLKAFIGRNHVVKECKGPNDVALNTIKAMAPVLTAASTRLTALAKHSKPSKPKKEECAKAIKVLTAYERILNDKGKKLSPKRKKELDRKRDAGTITSNDLPGGLDFPGGQLEGQMLKKIRELCKKK